MNIFLKATVGILAVIILLGLDKAWASDYSIRDKSLNLTVVMDEVPAPSGQGTVIKGYFKNEANGATGTINTFFKSEITGTQILEFSWVMDNCYGKYFVVPLWSQSSVPENIFQKSAQKKLVLNFIAGATCDGPLEKLKVDLGEGFYGTGSEENHVHIKNECPHKGEAGHRSNISQGKNGNNSSSNNGGNENKGKENSEKGNKEK